MILSDKHKFIFIHIPRTGGTIISKKISEAMGVKDWKSFIGEPDKLLTSGAKKYHPKLRKKLGSYKHVKANYLKEHVGQKKWKRYFKFSFVRNPWSRTLSHYLKYRKSKSKLLKKVWPKNSFIFDMMLITKYRILKQKSSQQVDYLKVDDDIGVDFVGRYEKINKDISKVCEKLGLQFRLNEKHDATRCNKGKNVYRKYYSELSKRIVKDNNIQDINKFGYKF